MKHFFTLLLLILFTTISHAQQISWDFSAGATTDGITKQNFPTMVVENGALKIVSNSGANPHIQFPIEGLDRELETVPIVAAQVLLTFLVSPDDNFSIA